MTALVYSFKIAGRSLWTCPRVEFKKKYSSTAEVVDSGYCTPLALVALPSTTRRRLLWSSGRN